MDFDYSDEQQQLKREARRFLDARCSSALVHQALDLGYAAVCKDLWTAVAELGWLGTVIPETHGGLGLGYVELCALAEELGRAVSPLPIASTVYLFSEALKLAGSAAQRTTWLPSVASGEIIGCLAVSEGPGELGRRMPAATFADGYLSGVKIPVVDGSVSDVAVVLAAQSGEPGLYLIELDQDGVQRSAVQSLDDSRGVARLTFTHVRAEPLGPAGAGHRILAEVVERAAVLIAFEQIGGADRCLEMARDYALQRHAFGRAVGSYQAIKHRLADMYVKNELARSNAYYAAWALATDSIELPVAAASARVAACDAYGFAAKENIQIHGGIGFTWQADPQLHYRRARHLSLVCGSSAAWSERLVAGLVRRQSA